VKIKLYDGPKQRKCEKVVRSGPRYSEKHRECCRFTQFLIDEKPYCHLHAGELALKNLIEEKEK